MTNTNTVNVTAESANVPLATPGDRRDPIAVEGTPGRIAKFTTATTIKALGFEAALVALAVTGAALVLVLFVLTSPAVSGSTTLTVTKTADTNDGACTIEDCSLREAIIASNGFSVDDIDVPAGTYKLTIPGSDEDNAATGDLDIRRGVTIRGVGARKTIIDGNGIDRVFHMPDQGNSPPFFVTIIGVTITGGASPNGTGGGIRHVARGATLNLMDSTVRGNSARDGGGIGNGLSLFMGGTTNIIRSTISGNKASVQAGGILSAAAMTLENTTVSDNESSLHGGGITQSDGTLRIMDSTIAFNTAQQPGGGIQSSGPSSPSLKNTIVSNNKSDFAFGKNCSSPVISEGNNLEKGTTCGFTQPTDINGDPQLGRLQNNGGLTNTHALQQGSPAIDTGGMPFLPTDQRGIARPQGVGNDIGAYEK
jgi:CSLREA domain-containing protein